MHIRDKRNSHHLHELHFLTPEELHLAKVCFQELRLVDLYLLFKISKLNDSPTYLT